jgi:hypothetical protein
LVTKDPASLRPSHVKVTGDPDHPVADDLDAVRQDFCVGRSQELGGRHAIARQKALHVGGWCVSRLASVDNGDSTPRPAEHQSGAQAGSSAADYRHGPIALAANGAPVLALELAGPAAADVRRLGQDLRARGAKLVRASDELDADLVLPQSPEWLAPIPATIAGQLLSFWLARARGRDPDYPVGLRKITKTL